MSTKSSSIELVSPVISEMDPKPDTSKTDQSEAESERDLQSGLMYDLVRPSDPVATKMDQSPAASPVIPGSTSEEALFSLHSPTQEISANSVTPPIPSRDSPILSARDEPAKSPAMPVREETEKPPVMPARENAEKPPAMPAREEAVKPPAMPAREEPEKSPVTSPTLPAMPARSPPAMPTRSTPSPKPGKYIAIKNSQDFKIVCRMPEISGKRICQVWKKIEILAKKSEKYYPSHFLQHTISYFSP
mgnify:CR=1 FL=1